MSGSSSERDRVRKGYAETADQYDEIRQEQPRGRLLSEHDVAMFRRILPECREGMKVLEVGAGTGRFTLPALEQGFRMVATDVNEPMLGYLRKKLSQTGYAQRCEIRIEDLFHLSFDDGQFDFVFCLHVIPRFRGVEDQQAGLRELARVVRPGGLLLFNYRNAKSPWHWIRRGLGQSPTQIRQLLDQCGMTITQVRVKHLLNRTLLDRLPLFCGRCLGGVDRLFETTLTGLGWDIFVLAQKGTVSRA